MTNADPTRRFAPPPLAGAMGGSSSSLPGFGEGVARQRDGWGHLLFGSLNRSGRIAPHARPDLAGIAEFDDVAEVLLGIEIVVLVLVVAAALDHRIAAGGEIGGRLLGVGIEELDVVQALAVLARDARRRSSSR